MVVFTKNIHFIRIKGHLPFIIIQRTVGATVPALQMLTGAVIVAVVLQVFGEPKAAPDDLIVPVMVTCCVPTLPAPL